jgi:hypothetical protein
LLAIKRKIVRVKIEEVVDPFCCLENAMKSVTGILFILPKEVFVQTQPFWIWSQY